MYSIEAPAIKTGNIYYFTTTSGIRYEVRFGRKRDQPLCATIVFGVVNNVYSDEEYKLTNRGEVWQVMDTIVNIVDAFKKEHNGICRYEIYALEKEGESEDEMGSRMNLYTRFIPRLFNPDWEVQIENNRAMITKKKYARYLDEPQRETYIHSQDTPANIPPIFETQFKTSGSIMGHLKNLFRSAN